MRNHGVNIFFVFAIVLSFLFIGCGTNSGGLQTSAPINTVSGVAASGLPILGTVTLRDSSTPARILTAKTSVNGSFSFVTGSLKAPYILMVSSTATGTFVRLCSLSAKNGTANINPFAHAALATAASVTDPSTVFANPDSTILQKAAANLPAAVNSLKDKLAPLFQMYGTSQNPITDTYTANHTGLDAMFDDVDFRLAAGWLNIKNRGTGGVIFSAAVNNISSGAFNSGNMPVVPGLIYGVSLYANYCASCHGALTSSTIVGRTASEITAAISSKPTMTILSGLTAMQIQAIATVLPQNIATTTVQTSCTYTYDAWGTCQSDGNQTRVVLSSTPDGCVGIPMLSQSCVYVAPAPAVCTYTYDAWGACQSDNTQTRNILTSSPDSCKGIPVLSQPCTYVPPTPEACTYTYDDWGICQPDNTQTRNVLTALPAGCAGTPVLMQSCTYAPPVCTFTYDAWGPCQPDNSQTRNVLSSSPADCTGLPFVTQYCIYTPPLSLSQVIPSCTMCHGLTVNNTVLGPGGYTVIGRSSTDWLTTVNTMVGLRAKLAPGYTAQDYANFLAGLP
jgi:hypothetical protein